MFVLGDINIDCMKHDETSKLILNTMKSYGLRDTIKSFTREAKQSKTRIDNIFTKVFQK